MHDISWPEHARSVFLFFLLFLSSFSFENGASRGLYIVEEMQGLEQVIA